MIRKSFYKEIICPLHPMRKEKVWFIPYENFYLCNGCENLSGACNECVKNMQELHGGFQDAPIEKQIREMFQSVHEKKQ